MTECTVTCQTCRVEGGQPKRWHWLCSICAEECQARHRRDTGHHTELAIVAEPSMEDLRHMIHLAAKRGAL